MGDTHTTIDPVADWLTHGPSTITVEQLEAAGYVIVRREAAAVARQLLERAPHVEDELRCFELALDPAVRAIGPDLRRAEQ